MLGRLIILAAAHMLSVVALASAATVPYGGGG
jgi:hypothetical protein